MMPKSEFYAGCLHPITGDPIQGALVARLIVYADMIQVQGGYQGLDGRTVWTRGPWRMADREDAMAVLKCWIGNAEPIRY
jgi:hypothetical protein